ncbi:uncharacterized protein LOC123701702 [Colias croceus]|uniref:uncharacterized protein LOC123701702 n=1 Tax=Colias crocea TaxID=72248 RepID=UPI001E27FC80|nr:uncharacterized protein LOC123701702 [Colias croceus]
MDFTPELSAFQGSIVSLDSSCAFSRITGRGGNEKKIEAVIKSLQDFMNEKGLNNFNLDNKINDTVRKFSLYIVLNADLVILQELVELDEIGSVIWTVPTIPACLLSEILWKLNMDNFIYEIIVFSYPQLSLEVSDILIENFKYFHPRQCFNQLKTLVTACYRFICRLLFFKLKNQELTQAVNNFHTCLKYFYEPPNAMKLEMLKRDEKYKYVGDNLHTMLLVLSECFNQYTQTQKLKPPDMHEIYELTYLEGCHNDTCNEVNLETCSNKDIKESIDNCNVMLLDTSKELVMEVSVEIYCAWSEFEDKNKSMQQTIGELCYTVKNTLININSICEHPVINMMEQICFKPIECVDVINDLNSDAIVQNITNSEEKDKWIKALLHRDNIFDDIILVEQISFNLTAFNNEDCCDLFKRCKEYLRTNSNAEYIQTLLIKVFQHCSVEDKMNIVKEHFNDTVFNDDLMTSQFNNMLTETFNKLTTSKDADLSDALTIFLQSPRNVYNKIFNLACENAHQTEIMVRVMKFLGSFSNYYYSEEIDSCVITVTKKMMQDDFEFEKVQNFIKFLWQIKNCNIIPGKKLFLLVVMPNLHSGIVSKNIIQIHMQCKLLVDAFSLDEIVEYKTPMLAMLAQVLDAVRWKITTFTTLAPSTLELALQLLLSILDSYSQDLPDNEKAWLKMKLKNINPLNMYYYRHLWNPPGDTFLEIVMGVHIHKDMDVELLTTRLSQVLPSTTLQEWHQIWDNLNIFSKKQIFNIYHDSLLLIAMAERNYHTPTTWAGIMYCFKNFVLITKSMFLIEPLEEQQVFDVMQKFILLENFVQEENLESFCNLVVPLFANMAEKQLSSINMWKSTCEKVKNKIFLEKITLFFKNCEKPGEHFILK